MSSKKHIACLLSGSMDSAVAALLTKRKGYAITCLHVRNKYFPNSVWEANCERVERIGRALNLPTRHFSPDSDSWQRFTQTLLKEYKRNLVPDAGVAFHHHILSEAALTHATAQLGASAVVSGHYVRTSFGENIFSSYISVLGNKLLKAVDLKHDQSFMLSQIVQKNLQKMIFPLGEFNREIMDKIVDCSELKDVPKDCFKTKTMLNGFEGDIFTDDIEQWIETKSGNITHIESGKCLKTHSDFKYGNSHQPTIKGVLTIGTNNEYCGNDHLILSSSQPVFAINPGSHVALYHDEHCIGGALVLRPGASQYALNYRKYRPKQPTGFQKAIAQIWSKLFFQ
ncbi:hypothetical protein CAPTEDRAFT_151514 [Capitella teleta]|uniref:Uncharacterized protein n=1 Tax=Capitella teleta TaxID=283909 RepID=R7TC38_CAPTE|nr:hypothetical protein CAPTEDRAFT_151514 [Capitella teleta]|eukprot:ELT89057.1 hypothetical protein CAPTEDRAFT_151514 [Capitella teleta]